MRRDGLIPGTYYRAKRRRGRELRLLESIRRGHCVWSPAPGFTGSDGRQLRAGRTCKLETFARWARGPEQLDLFGAPPARPSGRAGRGALTPGAPPSLAAACAAGEPFLQEG